MEYLEYYKNLSLENIIYFDLEGNRCVEQWRSAVTFEGCYNTSNLGRIKSIRSYKGVSERILKQKIDRDGYLVVSLCINGKRSYPAVHRLVALAFLPNPENLPEVNHRFGIKFDNREWMLEWMTQRDNQRHRSLMTESSSKYIGVYWNKRNQNWRTRIIINGKSIEIGSFKTENEAAKAYEVKYNEQFRY